MKIIGGDFNAELGPGEGIELSAVGHCTLNKANCRGEWLTQWLLENKLVALNTMYKKLPQKQVTYHTPMAEHACDGAQACTLLDSAVKGGDGPFDPHLPELAVSATQV